MENVMARKWKYSQRLDYDECLMETTMGRA
jgi:hypothetical protein